MALDLPSVDGDVGKDRRARNVPVPDVVMDELVVPLALTGLEIERDEAEREQIGARAMPAVVVAGRHPPPAGTRGRAPRRSTSAPRRPRCRCRPTSRSTRSRCRTLRPAGWCGRSRGACRCDVVAADVALLVPAALRRRARQVRGADHDVFPTTIGAACRPISPVTGSISWSSSVLRSTMPSLPKVGIGRPVFASSAIS